MASSSRAGGRILLVAAAAFACLCGLSAPSFVPGPQAAPAASPTAVATMGNFNPAVAASAALPALTWLAEDAEAKYGDARKWSAILVPLTTLVVPFVAMATFVLYSFSDDAFDQLIPGSKRSMAASAAWREHPLFANIKDPMNGLLNKDDFDKGLEEAWEKAKPEGSTVTVKDKLKELSTQNNPHFWQNKLREEESA